ncbi:MAG: Xaa-Pro peptidase family protein [Rhizobiaceae bacterium]|nr:Xaa-Pro peptidase family protein [Rhizobiaceae bacterium]
MQRGFPRAEFEGRMRRVQAMMAENDLAAILVTTHPDVYYFTGFLTRFWESPSRPWFVILPQSGEPVAVIPGIGEALMRSTWVQDIRTWAAPDLRDDGVSLLAETLREVAKGGRVGIPDGHESALRMPIADFERLKTMPDMPEIVSDAEIVRRARITKSEAEIAKIQVACDIAGRAFDRVHEIAQIGTSLETVFRHFQMLCLEEGADWVPYLAGGFGPEGYADVISPATTDPLQNGDCLMLDTGLVFDGYFCDYDRNFSLGKPPQLVADAHERLIEATAAGFEAAKPGARACDLYHAMDRVLTGGAGRNDNGRLGHGLGINLTEWPSFIAMDETVLEPGMVLTLEPGIETRNGNMLVHEEDIVITETGARYLSTPQRSEIRQI